MTVAAEPNFFIVGAAKSGTTALWYYLGQHPDCYVAPVKEPHRYATDLGLSQHPLLARHPELFLPPDPVDFWSARLAAVGERLGLDANSYPSLFDAVDDQHAIGEASPSYLLSKHAATAIRDHHPDARIVIVLRHPVDVMHSLHAMLRLGTLEPHWDLADAVVASRRRQRDEPAGHRVWTRYLDVVRFAPQVSRYLDAFPRDRIHISLFDDLRADPLGWLHGVQAFLGIAPIEPPDLRPANDSKVVRSEVVHRMFLDPPRPLRSLVRRLPERLRVGALRANVRPVRRDPLDPGFRLALTAELAPEIAELATLIDRDLSAWLDPSRWP